MYIANKARSTIAIALDALSGSTDVQSGDGSVFPPTTPYMVRVGPPDAPHEDMYVTAISGDTLNFARGTISAPREWPIGTAIELIDGDAWGIGATLTTQATHTTEIATNTSAIATNAANVAALQALVEQYMYLPSGWDAAWKAAKAASANSPASIIAIGDSITAGAYSTNILTTSWWALLRAYLLQGHTLGGDFYGPLYSSLYGGPITSPPLVYSGSVDFQAYGAYGTVLFDGTGAKNPLITFTTPYACTAFDIVYVDYATGTPSWTYKVDAASAVNVNTTGPGTAAGAKIKKISVTGQTNATHTIIIAGSGAAANTVAILGFAIYPDITKGIRFANHGWSGQGLIASGTGHNFYNDTTGVGGIDRVALFQGYQGTTASPTALTGFGFPTQPDLAIIALGVNDAAQSASATTFRDVLRRMVQSLRYGKADACSIMIVGMYTGDNVVASSTTITSTDYTSTQTPAIQDFYEAMLKVAQEYSCAYASVHKLFGRTPVANGWTTSVSNIHPTDAGYAKIATFLEQVL